MLILTSYSVYGRFFSMVVRKIWFWSKLKLKFSQQLNRCLTEHLVQSDHSDHPDHLATLYVLIHLISGSHDRLSFHWSLPPFLLFFLHWIFFAFGIIIWPVRQKTWHLVRSGQYPKSLFPLDLQSQSYRPNRTGFSGQPDGLTNFPPEGPG